MSMRFTSIYPDDPLATDANGQPIGAGATENLEYPGLPPGAVPDSRDLTLAAATPAGGTVLWQPAADERLVVTSLFISSDNAGRIAVVEDQDVQGQRIIGQYVAANGGSSPNLVPAPYALSGPGVPLRVFSTVVGNVFIRASGYIKP